MNEPSASMLKERQDWTEEVMHGLLSSGVQPSHISIKLCAEFQIQVNVFDKKSSEWVTRYTWTPDGGEQLMK